MSPAFRAIRGINFLGSNESHIYPNMCAKFGCGPTVVSRKKWGTDTHKGTPQLYIVDLYSALNV